MQLALTIPNQSFEPLPTRPLTRHFGSKWGIAKNIISHFYPHQTYTENYSGSACVFFRKQPARREVLNDLNPGTVNCLRMIQQFPGDVIQALSETPKTADDFSGCFLPSDDPIEWARRYLCLGWGGYMGAGGRWSGGCSEERLKRMQRMDFSFLWQHSARLQNTIIQHGDALTALVQYDSPGTLHYVDPPYPKEARGSRDNRVKDGTPRRQYAYEMLDRAQHERLADTLNGLSGAVVLSGRQCSLYDELFGHWQRFDYAVSDSNRERRVESIWIKP